jgi:metalloendopeptidase OMA1, mitochondrial
MHAHARWCLSLLMLTVSFVLGSCAKEPVVHTPPTIHVLTKHESGAAMAQSPSKAARYTTQALVEPVLRVSSRLIAAAGQTTEYAKRAGALCWVIAVYDDQAGRRSFVGADGAIVVSSGAFRLLETEGGLAAWLSHELVHALTDTAPPSTGCLIESGQEPALVSRDEEEYADEKGLTLMADAGYDPREALQLWERMKHDNRQADEVLTHVTYERRMERIVRSMPHALVRFERANRAPQKVLPLR